MSARPRDIGRSEVKFHVSSFQFHDETEDLETEEARKKVCG
jgi:hypothetical protein